MEKRELLVKRVDNALEAHGSAAKKLGQSSGAVLSALEKRLPKK
jgi:hypothetical protein